MPWHNGQSKSQQNYWSFQTIVCYETRMLCCWYLFLMHCSGAVVAVMKCFPSAFHANFVMCGAWGLLFNFLCLVISHNSMLPCWSPKPAKHRSISVKYVTSYTDSNGISLDSVLVRASDLWSTSCEFNSRPCTAGLVLRWVTVCGRVIVSVCNQSPRSTQPSIPPG